MHFSFFTFFSDFGIFQVVKFMLLIFHDFQFSCLQWTFLNFPPFSVFLAIFHVLKCVFLIFHDFQFYRNIPGPTVCISNFSSFSVISSFSSRQVDVTHFHDFQFSCLEWTFQNLPHFQFSSPYFTS